MNDATLYFSMLQSYSFMRSQGPYLTHIPSGMRIFCRLRPLIGSYILSCCHMGTIVRGGSQSISSVRRGILQRGGLVCEGKLIYAINSAGSGYVIACFDR